MDTLSARLDAARAEVVAITTRVTTAVHQHATAAREARDAAALLRRDDAAIPRRARAVLVVDDDRHARETLTDALSARLPGVSVLGVESLTAAAVALRRTRYAVLVVDYHLGDGRSGLDYARTLDRGPRPIVVTGRVDVDHLRALGARVDVPVFGRPITSQAWDDFAAYVEDQVERATE